MDGLSGRLGAPQVSGLVAAGSAVSFDDVEQQVCMQGRELLRKITQHVMDVRACREQRLAGVADAAGVARTRAERGHARTVVSQFGPVTVRRMAYRAPGLPNLHPRDAVLNLPPRRYSWQLQQAVVRYALAGSYEASRPGSSCWPPPGSRSASSSCSRSWPGPPPTRRRSTRPRPARRNAAGRASRGHGRKRAACRW